MLLPCFRSGPTYGILSDSRINTVYMLYMDDSTEVVQIAIPPAQQKKNDLPKQLSLQMSDIYLHDNTF